MILGSLYPFPDWEYCRLHLWSYEAYISTRTHCNEGLDAVLNQKKCELKIELPTKPLTKSQKHYRFFISSIKGNPKRRSNIIHHHSSSRFQSVLLPTSASSLLFAPPAIFYPIQLIDSFTLAPIRSKERKISDNQRPSWAAYLLVPIGSVNYEQQNQCLQSCSTYHAPPKSLHSEFC